MKNKTILITGGNSGIGKATALSLAGKGAQLILACRNVPKAEKAAAGIRQISGNPNIDLLACDLASFQSVRSAVDQFHERYSRLDVLINNAGLISNHHQLTADGFELQFGVNHLGHFLLTMLLLDKLKQAPQARIVNVSSLAYLRGKIDFDRVQGAQPDYNGWQAYGQSKLANVLFTRELARQVPEIDCNCLHPGVVRSEFGNKDLPWYYRLSWLVMKPFLISTQKGAKTSVYLASSPKAAGISGRFFDEKCQVRNFSGQAKNEQLAKELWEKSRKWTGI